MFTVCRRCNLRFRHNDRVCGQCGCRTAAARKDKGDMKPMPFDKANDQYYGGRENYDGPALGMVEVTTAPVFRRPERGIRLAGTAPGQRLRIKSK